MMRFRGGGVGHSSTRADTDAFKDDRDGLDIISQRAREPQTNLNVQADEDHGMDSDDSDDEMNAENLDGEKDMEGEVDEDDQLSDSELVDYGYELEIESDEEDDDREAGEEDDTAVDELGTLGYADY